MNTMGTGLFEEKEGGERRAMLLTIITPTLNCAPFLPSALTSAELVEQRFPGKIQHLIADGGSTDGTRQLLAEYAARNSWARIFQTPNNNIPVSLNQLLPFAQGAWMLVLNGDDTLELETFTDCLNMIGVREMPSIVCGDVILLSRNGCVIGERRAVRKGIRWSMSVNHAAMLCNKAAIQAIGPFQEDCPTSYDYAWIWQAHRLNVPIEIVRKPLARYMLGGISTTRRRDSNREIIHFKRKAGHHLEAAVYWSITSGRLWLQEIGVPPWHLLMRALRQLIGTSTEVYRRPYPRTYREITEDIPEDIP